MSTPTADIPLPDTTPETPSLSLIVTGADRPGVTNALLTAVSRSGAVVLDIQQVIAQGHLTLGLVVTGPDLDAARDAAAVATHRLGLQLTTSVGTGDNRRPAQGRASVVMLGKPLTAASVARVTERIASRGVNIDRIRRLSRYPVTTIELDVSGLSDLDQLRAELGRLSAEEGLDIAVAPGGLARRGRRLVVLDVDSTFIQQEVIELLAAHAGREAEVAAVTERAMRGELDFEQSLRQRVQALAGLPASVIDEVRGAIELTPGARTLVRTLKRLGYTVGLVSGGFIEIVGPLAASLGIDHARANQLEVVQGRLTGRVVGAVVDRAAKAASLREFADLEGLPLSRTVAIGDGANDLDMLALAGLGVAFNAKPLVQQQADTTVNVPYLDAVLHMLGISREEIEEADALDAVMGTAKDTAEDTATDTNTSTAPYAGPADAGQDA